MRVFSTWQLDPVDGRPRLVSAYDEVTREQWAGAPDWHYETLAKANGAGAMRDAIIEVDDDALIQLFAKPTGPAYVVKPHRRPGIFGRLIR